MTENRGRCFILVKKHQQDIFVKSNCGRESGANNCNSAISAFRSVRLVLKRLSNWSSLRYMPRLSLELKDHLSLLTVIDSCEDDFSEYNLHATPVSKVAIKAYLII